MAGKTKKWTIDIYTGKTEAEARRIVKNLERVMKTAKGTKASWLNTLANVGRRMSGQFVQ